MNVSGSLQHALIRRAARRRFAALRVRGLRGQGGLGSPLLLCPNHTNWWDGFVALCLMDELPGRRFAVAQEERQLERYPWFRAAGAIGIDPRTPGALRRSFSALISFLEEPGAGLFYFPEGVMGLQGGAPPKLRRGLGELARRTRPAVVPMAFHYGFREGSRPEVWVLAGTALRGSGAPLVSAVEKAMAGLIKQLHHDWHSLGGTARYRALWSGRSIHENWWARLPGRRHGGSGRKERDS